jgi:DNA primase
METTWVDYRAVKRTVTIEMVLNRYGVKLRRSGKELRGKCPIHQGEGTNTFHANTDKNIFQCFSGACKAKGNVLDFVAAMEKCTVREAAARLHDWFAVPAGKPEIVSATTSGAEPVSQLATKETRGESTEPNKPLTFQLKGINHEHEYLAGRGISKETAQTFGVGFFPGKGTMSGRVVIPIHNERGELVAYVGRSIDGSDPRYKVPGGFHKSQEVYNLHRAIAAFCSFEIDIEVDQKGIIVVEGYFDAMKVHQAGYPFVVALMGCSLSEEQERLLVAHASMILVMLDGDEAGRKATDEIMLRLGRRVWIKSITLPDGRQPDQMSAEELTALLSEYRLQKTPRGV